MTTRDEKEKMYEDIKWSLKTIAVARRVLMDTQEEEKSEIDKFITEFGGKEIEKIEQMSRNEFMTYMVKSILERVVGD